MDVQIKMDLKLSLQRTVNIWVDRTFNFLPLEVVEKWSDNNLFEYIRNPSTESILADWLWEMDSDNIIMDFCEKNTLDFNLYGNQTDGTLEECFRKAYGDAIWFDFLEYLKKEYEYEIDDFANEKMNENYPMWNTLFEFRDSFYNSDEDSEKILSVGLGLIEGLEPFNNMIFMTSGGHSFYSDYWIPLYLKFYPDEAVKYKDIDYSDL
jgi:hypothetical protein